MNAKVGYWAKVRTVLIVAVSIHVGVVLVLGAIGVLRLLASNFFDAALPEWLALVLFLVGNSAVGACLIAFYRRRVAKGGQALSDASNEVLRFLRVLVVGLTAGGAIVIAWVAARYLFPGASPYEIVGSITMILCYGLAVFAVLRGLRTADADLKRRAYVYAAKGLAVGSASLAMIPLSDYLQ